MKSGRKILQKIEGEGLLTWGQSNERWEDKSFFLLFKHFYIKFTQIDFGTFHSSLAAQNRPSCSVGSLHWLYPVPSNGSLSSPAQPAALYTLYESLPRHHQLWIIGKNTSLHFFANFSFFSLHTDLKINKLPNLLGWESAWYKSGSVSVFSSFSLLRDRRTGKDECQRSSEFQGWWMA